MRRLELYFWVIVVVASLCYVLIGPLAALAGAGAVAVACIFTELLP